MTTNEAFAAAVKQQINGDKNHGWGADDSLAVILAVIASETGTKVEDLKEIAPLVKEVVNPSQFRQKLESRKVLNPSAKGPKATKAQLDALLKDL